MRSPSRAARFSTSLALTVVVLVFLLLGRPDSHAGNRPRKVLTPLSQSTTPQGVEKVTDIVTPSGSLPPKPSLPASAQLWQGHIFFERNDGQVDGQVLYLSRGPQYTLFLTRTGVAITFSGLQNKKSINTRRGRYFRLRYVGANPEAQVTGMGALPGTSNYFSGSDPTQWHTRIPQFEKVRYSNLYPGVDLVFYFRDGHLEYDLVASPGADLNSVHFQIEGAQTYLTPDGALAIKIGEEEVVRFRKPSAYQHAAALHLVQTHYSLRHGQLSFAVGRYDRAQPLVIDPALIFATYITSNCSTCVDQISDIAADTTGVYLTGSTNASSYPATAAGATPTQTSNQQTFILKLDPTGSRILYSTFLSGSFGASIALDSNGSAHVSGTAYDSAFPLTSGVFSGTFSANAAGSAAYAAKLSSDGSSILYSTLLQQPNPNGTLVTNFQAVNPSKIAVDSTGALYITGIATPNSNPRISSIWMSLPVTLGAFQTTPGAVFVLKLNPNASGVDYATYIDGIGATASTAVGIAVDSSGDAFVAGSTVGNAFPTTPGAYETSVPVSGYYTTFVMKLNPAGTAPVYSTLFGPGTTNMEAFGLGVDPHGAAVVAGFSVGDLPITTGAFCGNAPPPSATEQGYVVKFTSDGSGLVYATSLCANNSSASAVAVDSSGAAYVVGSTGFAAQFQPYLVAPIQGYTPSTTNFVNLLVKLDTSGNPQWSTFLGVNYAGLFPTNSKLAIDATGNVYVLAESDIPPTPKSIGPPSLNPGVPGNAEVLNYLLKIAPSLGAPVPMLNPRQVLLGVENVGVASPPADVQVGNFGDAPMSPAVSITGDFSETDNCSAAVPGGQKCDINVVFTPTALGNRTGTLMVSFGGNIPSQTIPLSGDGVAPAVTLAPTSLYFGVQANGTTSGQQQVTVTNTGTGSLGISSVQTTSEFAATNTCGAALVAGNSCTIQVTFTPTASGIQTGTLTITDNASGSPQTVALTGNQTGNAAVTLSPTSLGFGTQASGTTSAPQPVAVANSGSAPLVISSVQTTSQFAATNTCSAPIQAGSTCTIQVTFTPSASGSQTGTLTIADNASNSPQTVSLTGNQPANFSLSAPGGSAATSSTVTAGQTATYNLSVTGTNGFSGPVNFTCSGAPSKSTCSVSPNPANITGTSAVALTVSLATQAASSITIKPLYRPTSLADGYSLVGIVSAFALLLSFALAPRAKGRHSLGYAAGTLAITMLTVVFVGCGGSGSSSSTPPVTPGTTAGQYTLTVTGASGSLSQSMSLSLTVK